MWPAGGRRHQSQWRLGDGQSPPPGKPERGTSRPALAPRHGAAPRPGCRRQAQTPGAGRGPGAGEPRAPAQAGNHPGGPCRDTPTVTVSIQEPLAGPGPGPGTGTGLRLAAAVGVPVLSARPGGRGLRVGLAGSGPPLGRRHRATITDFADDHRDRHWKSANRVLII